MEFEKAEKNNNKNKSVSCPSYVRQSNEPFKWQQVNKQSITVVLPQAEG